MNEPKLTHVPTAHCTPAPWANRADLNLTPEFLADIETRGVRQSLEVRRVPNGKTDRYEIIAGVRRHAAATKAKLETVPVLIVEASDQQGREARLIENLHREGLTALDEAQQYQEALASGDYGPGAKAVEALAAKIGKSRSHLYARLKLLKLNPAVRKAVTDGSIDQTVAELIATIPDKPGQERALGEILKGEREWNPQSGKDERSPMSFRRVREFISDEFRRDLKEAPFKLDQVYQGVVEGRLGKGCQLVTCGTCAECPKRSGNFPDLPKGANPDVCTDVACYDAKADAEWELRKQAAEKNDQRVIEPEEWTKIHYRTDLVDTTEKCYEDSKSRTYGTLAKAGELKTALVRDDDGAIFEVVPRGEAKKAGGVKERSYGGGGGRSKEDKAREAKKKLRVEVAKAAAPKLAEFYRKDSLALWQLIAQSAYDHTSIDDHCFVAKRRGLAKVLKEVRLGLEKWLKQDHTQEEFRDFALELLLFSSHGVNNWSQAWDKTFKAMCDHAKLDLDKLEKHTAEELQKPKSRPEAAKAKGKAKK